MIHNPLGSRYAIGGALGRSIKRAASGYTTWYTLDGEITPIIAYQAKGAANLAASYVNLITPGTLDAGVGNAPDWDATNGWKLTAASSHYLSTGLPYFLTNTRDTIIKWSNASAGCASGGIGANGYRNYWMKPVDGGYMKWGYANSIVSNYTQQSSGVFALANDNVYLNGVDIGNIGVVSGGLGNFPIGAYSNNGTIQDYFTGYIQAFAVYADITAEQVVKLIDAMNAL